MKLAAALTVLGLGLGVTTFAVTQGCSSSSSSTDATAQVGKVPPASEGTPTTSTDANTFALKTLSLGEADRSGNKNANAWKDYGYNLDGLVSTVTDQNSPDLGRLCKRVTGAPAAIHQDGTDGIDNSFGKTIIALLAPFTPTPSKTISDAIQAGEFTILLKIVGLTADAAQTNTGLSGTLLVGGAYSAADPPVPPTFDLQTDWPYMSSPQVAINGAYINKGTFVNGTGGATVQLSLSISGQALNLTINRAIISFQHNGASLDNGTIAGVLNTEEFVSGISSVAGRFSTDLCAGSTVEGIKTSIRQASDIMSDGTQDPSKTCDGITVGIGFTAAQVANPTKIAVPGPTPADPCTDAGAAPPADAGTDAH